MGMAGANLHRQEITASEREETIGGGRDLELVMFFDHACHSGAVAVKNDGLENAYQPS
jgi:hypothetical protein